MTNQMIRRFQLKGMTDDKNLEGEIAKWRRQLTTEMKDYGYVPVIDLNPILNMKFNEQKEIFEFTYTWQGVYVGKDKSWQTEGVSDGKQIRSIPRIK